MMKSRQLPEGAFRAQNGVWCVKRTCERCKREFNAGLALNPKYCKGCRQVLKNRKNQKTAKSRQKAFVPQKSVWERRDENAALKQEVRRCHDCGKPSGGNYRCPACWSKIRNDNTDERTDGYYVYE